MKVNMEIESIRNKFKILVINTETKDLYILKSDRQVSEYLKKEYDIILSHMYINRKLQDENYILKGNILIKRLW